jgi:hypothetical protein
MLGKHPATELQAHFSVEQLLSVCMCDYFMPLACLRSASQGLYRASIMMKLKPPLPGKRTTGVYVPLHGSYGST